MRLVRLRGEALRHLPWTAGQEVEFRVDPRAFRHYTPSRYDPERGEMEILFYLHGYGPGSDWVSHLVPEQPIALMGPGHGLNLATESAWHLVIGDETTIGLFLAYQEALPSTQPLLGAVEVAAGEEGIVRRLELPLEAVSRAEGRPGEQLIT